MDASVFDLSTKQLEVILICERNFRFVYFTHEHTSTTFKKYFEHEQNIPQGLSNYIKNFLVNMFYKIFGSFENQGFHKLEKNSRKKIHSLNFKKKRWFLFQKTI